MTSLDDVQVHLISNVDDAAECARWLSTTDVIAVDTESEGLNPHIHKVRLLQLGDDRCAYVFPIELPRSWAGFALDLLDKYDGTIVAHNLKFDQRMIRRWLNFEFKTNQLEDTMLMSRVLEPTRSAALKRLSAQLIDPRAQAMDATLAEAMKVSGYDWRTVPLTFDYYWFYAGVDTVLTRRIYDVLKPQVTQSAPRAYELELVTSIVCGRMEDHGAKIDVPFARDRYAKLNEFVTNTAKWCQSTYGVNPGSNAQVVEALTDAGHTFIKLTKGGNTSLDKEVLSEVDHPLAHAVLQRRQAQKISSTYLRHFIDDVDDDDRLHPNINSCEARTGRMSMSEPNLQNLPRSSETNRMSKAVRDCIIPAEGHTLLMCDFDQIEFRIYASLTGDERLATAFSSDEDVFTVLCRQIFNDPSIIKSDSRRQVTKNSIYARLFGAGTEKFAWTAGITVDEARQFNALLDQQYPAIRSQQQAMDLTARRHLEAEGTAYLNSTLTNRRFVIDDDATYKLVNYAIQGTAAEVLKMKIVELAQAGLEDYMVVPVHDEIIFEVPTSEVEEVAEAISRIMNDHSLFRIPITAGLSKGVRWGDKIEYQVH